MYGLVNKAIEDLVVSKFGMETWREIKTKANLQVEAFLTMENYPDEITYNLVGAASEVLGMSAPEVLREFGRYWIKYSSHEGYGSLLNMTGTNLISCLQKLDQLHGRLSVSFPNYKPPSFKCSEIKEKSLRLHYHTRRDGLTYFVVGLIEELGNKFDTPARVTVDKSKDNGHSHDEFIVEI